MKHTGNTLLQEAKEAQLLCDHFHRISSTLLCPWRIQIPSARANVMAGLAVRYGFSLKRASH